jgi:hypothetical protein
LAKKSYFEPKLVMQAYSQIVNELLNKICSSEILLLVENSLKIALTVLLLM